MKRTIGKAVVHNELLVKFLYKRLDVCCVKGWNASLQPIEKIMRKRLEKKLPERKYNYLLERVCVKDWKERCYENDWKSCWNMNMTTNWKAAAQKIGEKSALQIIGRVSVTKT